MSNLERRPMNRNEKIVVIILAAGEGRRFSRLLPKQFLVLEKKPVFIHSLLRVLRGLKYLPETVVICVPSAHERLARQMVEKYLPQKWRKRTALVQGGKTRIASYDAAVKYLSNASIVYDIVITQDAARPCTQPNVIPRLLARFQQVPGSAVCITGASLTESLFIKRQGGGLQSTNREQYLLGRTPYVFAPKALRDALARWKRQGGENGPRETADILEFLPSVRGQRIEVLETDEPNPKLTVLEDVESIRRCLKKFR